MGILKPMESAPSYAKIALQGGPGSGKTRTGTEIAVGIRDHFKLQAPLAFFDTEGGAGYVKDLIVERTGKVPLHVASQRFDDLLETMRECEKEGLPILLVDSIT